MILGACACALGATSIAARRLAVAQSAVPVRREITTMAPDDPDLVTWREGVGIMRARSEANPLDPLGWHIYGGQHSLFCATNAFRMQIHYGWFFLPWHRAYLINLERKIRFLTRTPGFALPYWDWTRSRRLPAALFEEASPLRDPTRIQALGDEIPPDFTELGPAMRGPTMRHFAGYPRSPSEPQIEGTLEQGAHNNVHNWIGGNMASFDGAGFDPMFALHHGNVDRLWEAWKAADPSRRDPGEPAWSEHRFPFWGVNGDVEAFRVGDLTGTERQGYRYDRLDWRHTLDDAPRPTFPGGEAAMRALTFSAAQLAGVRNLASGERRGRVLVQYRRLQLPIHPLCHRVFVLHPNADRTAPEATYCGTFTLLPIPGAETGLENFVSTQLEVTEPALGAVLSGAPVSVAAVPVELKGRVIPTEPLRFGDVELTIDA